MYAKAKSKLSRPVLALALLVGPGCLANPTTGDSIPHWKLQWSEEFNTPGAPDPAIWGYENGYVRNQELQYYTNSPKNVVVTGGALRLRLQKEAMGGKNWTSASIITMGKKTFQYGRIEVRAKLPPGMGSWPAIWTLGANGSWPAGGEIDIMEYDRNQWPADTNLIDPFRVTGTVHYADAAGKHAASSGDVFMDDPTKDFHVYALEWDAKVMRWFVDDRMFKELDISSDAMSAFRQPHYLLLNLALNQGAHNPGYDTMDYLVDYVRYYQVDTKTPRRTPPQSVFNYVNRAYAQDTVTFSVTPKVDSTVPASSLAFRWEAAQIARPFHLATPDKPKSPILFPKGGWYVLWCTVSDGLYSHRASLYYQVGIEAAQAFPAGARFTDSIQVKLSNPNPKAKIQYTTDGTDPTSTSPVYTGPLVFKENTTLKTISSEEGLPISKVTSNSYTKGSLVAGLERSTKPSVVSLASGVNVQVQAGAGPFTVTMVRADGKVVEQGSSNGDTWHSQTLGGGVFHVRVRGDNVVPTDAMVVR
ncbi:MAG TPA: family 16 glycosylhydrolase [Fibrobacteria bacterium]|nr:family 16 glycosylhydrolase [Fibrobacteria bacterium]